MLALGEIPEILSVVSLAVGVGELARTVSTRAAVGEKSTQDISTKEITSSGSIVARALEALLEARARSIASEILAEAIAAEKLAIAAEILAERSGFTKAVERLAEVGVSSSSMLSKMPSSAEELKYWVDCFWSDYESL